MFVDTFFRFVSKMDNRFQAVKSISIYTTSISNPKQISLMTDRVKYELNSFQLKLLSK